MTEQVKSPIAYGHSTVAVVEESLYVYRKRRLIRDGSPGRPP